MSTTLNDLLAKYNEAYARYAMYIVDLHNAHYRFIQNGYSLVAGREVRGALREMTILQKELGNMSKDIYKAQLADKKAMKAQRKELEAQKRIGRPERIKGLKHGQRNNTTKDSI